MPLSPSLLLYGLSARRAASLPLRFASVGGWGQISPSAPIRCSSVQHRGRGRDTWAISELVRGGGKGERDMDNTLARFALITKGLKAILYVIAAIFVILAWILALILIIKMILPALVIYGIILIMCLYGLTVSILWLIFKGIWNILTGKRLFDE